MILQVPEWLQWPNKCLKRPVRKESQGKADGPATSLSRRPARSPSKEFLSDATILLAFRGHAELQPVQGRACWQRSPAHDRLRKGVRDALAEVAAGPALVRRWACGRRTVRWVHRLQLGRLRGGATSVAFTRRAGECLRPRLSGHHVLKGPRRHSGRRQGGVMDAE